ncbi:MAG TPA: DUF6328 family protein [Caldimonas sp.]
MADRTTLESPPLQDDEGAWLALIEATPGRRRKPKYKPEGNALMLSNERGRRRCAERVVNGAAEARSDATRGHERQSLGTALGHMLDEARMVLPGVQALFGFQLIGVFSDGFGHRLSELEQQLHLAAIVLVTIAIALLVTPAAYHQQVDRRRATAAFLALASRLVICAMLPLAAGWRSTSTRSRA